jgi:hypothetical protein
MPLYNNGKSTKRSGARDDKYEIDEVEPDDVSGWVVVELDLSLVAL